MSAKITFPLLYGSSLTPVFSYLDQESQAKLGRLSRPTQKTFKQIEANCEKKTENGLICFVPLSSSPTSTTMMERYPECATFCKKYCIDKITKLLTYRRPRDKLLAPFEISLHLEGPIPNLIKLKVYYDDNDYGLGGLNVIMDFDVDENAKSIGKKLEQDVKKLFLKSQLEPFSLMLPNLPRSIQVFTIFRFNASDAEGLGLVQSIANLICNLINRYRPVNAEVRIRPNDAENDGMARWVAILEQLRPFQTEVQTNVDWNEVWNGIAEVQEAINKFKQKSLFYLEQFPHNRI